MEREFDALLFDIDGTLVDSTPAVERIWHAWGRERGIDPERILAVSHGRRAADTIRDFLPAEEVADGVRLLQELEAKDTDGVVALPATQELLAELPARRWAAVTSGDAPLMRRRLSMSGLPIPEVLVGAEDVEQGKPDPSGYLQAAQRLGVPIENCLVIEDAPAGIRAGRSAGATVLGTATSHPAGALGEADDVVEDLTHLEAEVLPDGRIRVQTDGAG